MLFSVGILLQISGSLVAAESLRGVADELLYLYRPLATDSTKWACLSDPSIVLNLSQINDNYCDCPDGSDEPGTSACGSKSRFFCENQGFAPRYISGSKVDDGVCDCCDCSDENFASNSSWVGSQSCQDLHSEYEQLISKELREQRRGSLALTKLKSEYGVSTIDGDSGEEQQIQDLTSSIEELNKALIACEQDLKEKTALYRRKLRVDNPTLYNFEKLNISYLSSTVDYLFTNVEAISRSYHSLIHIMDDLTYDFNKKLNDQVVNGNVMKYIDYMQKHSGDIEVSPQFDQEQREQVKKYLTSELPQMFRKGSSSYPLLAIKGKFAMVKAIIKVKMKYKDEVLEVIKHLCELMDDVSTNYNVNVQDAGVRKAVSAYGDFLAEYAGIFDVIEVPEKFKLELQRLEDFLDDEAPRVAASAYDVENTIVQQIKNFLSKFRSSVSDGLSNLGDLEATIATIESNRALLNHELQERKNDLQELLRLADIDNSEKDARKIKEISELFHKMDPGCINDAFNNYLYQICFNSEEGRIVQKEDKPQGNSVLIGKFQNFKLDPEISAQRFIDGLRNEHSESDLLAHLESEERSDKTKLLIGNLPDVNSGLIITYGGGARCWNGPARSAQVSFRCSDTFKLRNVYEPTRCHYVFEIDGPLGCTSSFNYEYPAWF
ncbi:LAFE_0H05446g1_1 [Lachancea fermentati]|uniref:Glucosidase 2 subunit beta n=1 Tax=Lachancea fermentati TaxID=4955 RepID=A0A1G4MK11_LACFM|nr:LAFE_0H05446g1_1 [Lachancea fermentati]